MHAPPPTAPDVAAAALPTPLPASLPASLPAAWRRRIFWSGAVAIGAVRLVYYVFHDFADGDGPRLAHRLFEEATGLATALPLLWGAVRIEERLRLAARPWRRALPTLAALLLAYSLPHTTAMLAVRALLGPLLGLGDYAPRALAWRYGYELANDVLPFGLVMAALGLAERAFALAASERARERAARARERREAALQRSLLEAELRALRLQLQPHFLFNALNTVASTMYDDPAAADALLGHVAELLRTSLRTTHAHEVPLREEVALLEQYLALMRARFGERLTATVDVEPAALDGRVPSMLLQPLVENAVRHGGVSATGRGVVTVAARRIAGAGGAPDALELRVHDDGPGLAPGRDPLAGGTGLSTTRRRLALLHGDAATLVAGDAPDGGFAVTVRVPWRPAEPTPAPDGGQEAPDALPAVTADAGSGA